MAWCHGWDSHERVGTVYFYICVPAFPSCVRCTGQSQQEEGKESLPFRTLMSRLISCLQCTRKSREGEGKTRPLNELLLFWLEAPLIKRGIVIVPAGIVWTSNSKCVWEILLISFFFFFFLEAGFYGHMGRKNLLLRRSDSSLSYISFFKSLQRTHGTSTSP